MEQVLLKIPPTFWCTQVEWLSDWHTKRVSIPCPQKSYQKVKKNFHQTTWPLTNISWLRKKLKAWQKVNNFECTEWQNQYTKDVGSNTTYIAHSLTSFLLQFTPGFSTSSYLSPSFAVWRKGKATAISLDYLFLGQVSITCVYYVYCVHMSLKSFKCSLEE